MKSKTVEACLASLSSVKKGMVLSRLVISAWTEALKDLTDEQGEAAFKALMRHTIYGDLEPGHVVEEAERQRREVLYRKAPGTIPWIHEAPSYSGEKDYWNPSKAWQAWLKRERSKQYRAISNDGQRRIVLIRNPEAWDWRIAEDGRPVFVRPPSIDTGEVAPKLSSVVRGVRFEGEQGVR